MRNGRLAILSRMSYYRKLEVWQKAFGLTVDTIREADNIVGRTGSLVRDQMVRSVLSIPSNIAEGSAKRSDREFARFVRIALGSATETENHLLVISALNFDGRKYLRAV